MLAEKFINFYNHHESLQKALQEKFPKVEIGPLIRNLTDNNGGGTPTPAALSNAQHLL